MNPAAWRCPPPPSARAMIETSTRPSVARRLHLALTGAVGRQQLADSTATAVPSTCAQVVDDPLGVGLDRAGLGEVLRA